MNRERKKERFTVKVENSYCDYLLKDMTCIEGFNRRKIEETLDYRLSLAIDRLGEYEDADENVKKK